MNDCILPTSADWDSVDLADGLLAVDGGLAQLLYPELWRGCVLAYSHGLDQRAQDYSGRQHTGTRVGAVADAPAGWLFSGGHIASPDRDDLTFSTGSADLPFSLACWVRKTGAGVQCPVSKASSTGLGEYYLLVGSSGEVYFRIADNDAGVFGGYAGVVTGNSLVPADGTLHSIVATYDGRTTSPEGGMSLYVDGVRRSTSTASSGTYTRMRNTSQPFELGRRGAAEWAGTIDSVALWSRLLPFAEITTFAQRPHVAYECALWPPVFPVGLEATIDGTLTYKLAGPLHRARLAEPVHRAKLQSPLHRARPAKRS